MTHLRCAGHGRLPDGRAIAWSLAEGARGRRWRWTLTTGEGNLVHVGLLELDVEGRFARLELETGTGMLTLHPTADGRVAHGNVVRTDRVDPIAVEWPATAAVVIAGDPFGSALAGWRGTGWLVRGDLTLEWDPTDPPALEVDARGIPAAERTRGMASGGLNPSTDVDRVWTTVALAMPLRRNWWITWLSP